MAEGPSISFNIAWSSQNRKTNNTNSKWMICEALEMNDSNAIRKTLSALEFQSNEIENMNWPKPNDENHRPWWWKGKKNWAPFFHWKKSNRTQRKSFNSMQTMKWIHFFFHIVNSVNGNIWTNCYSPSVIHIAYGLWIVGEVEMLSKAHKKKNNIKLVWPETQIQIPAKLTFLKLSLLFRMKLFTYCIITISIVD